ncbi:MAG: pyrroloquinoline quinone-dependent dehydrogenase [Chitinophagaceae bacterium]
MKKLLLIPYAVTMIVSCQSHHEWREYLGGPERNHYSALDQINTSNVHQLEKAWEYHTNDSSAQNQCNPIIVDGIIYATTASVEVFALDASTGKEIWRYRNARDTQWFSKSRGVVYWEDRNDKRILFSAGSHLYALDATKGSLIESFGDSGYIDLKMGLGERAKGRFVAAPTPGTVFQDLIIMPLHMSESAGAAPGFIQAFNIKSGKLEWVFKTIPGPGEYGYETWEKDNYLNEEVGGANAWSGMSIDRDRGIVFVPTGSAAFDFYGGNRKGDNLFANCLLALDAKTGKRIWHFQFTHHDVWDRDLPAPPNLIKIKQKGRLIDAVAQITKQGFVYVFERETGKPVFPIDEIPVATDGVPGEVLSPTQPIPRLPKPFARNRLTEKDINPAAENYTELLEFFKGLRKNLYDPPSKQGTIMFPGFDGGGEWGGAAFDPETGYMYVNANEMAWILKLEDIKNQSSNSLSNGNNVYIKYCQSCHKSDLTGNANSGYPSLVGIGSRRDRGYINKLLSGGKGMMPGFPQLSKEEKESLVDYLLGTEKKEVVSGRQVSKSKIPYSFAGYNKFLDKNGYPAITPPWGTLTAIDLNTGEHVWQRPLGEFKELTAKGMPVTGTENYGGGVVTKGGLFLIAATNDKMFRAFDKLTGKLLWQKELPTSSFASLSTYENNGIQYIVLNVGGTKLGAKKGDSFIAFKLKNSKP